MKLRYKTTGREFDAYQFNMCALAEVMAYDDSVPVTELGVFIVAIGEWKDMRQAFKDHDIITDNWNRVFFEPTTSEDRARGYTL